LAYQSIIGENNNIISHLYHCLKTRESPLQQQKQQPLNKHCSAFSSITQTSAFLDSNKFLSKSLRHYIAETLLALRYLLGLVEDSSFLSISLEHITASPDGPTWFYKRRWIIENIVKNDPNFTSSLRDLLVEKSLDFSALST
jgi:hypothetical protein